MRRIVLFAALIPVFITVPVAGASVLSVSEYAFPANDTPFNTPPLTSKSLEHKASSPVKPMEPLKLLSFEAYQDERTVVLEWVSLSEQNSKYFVVERTRDGVAYEPVATLQAAGNSNLPVKYTARDTSPHTGTSFYRLRETDFNNNMRYSVNFKISIRPEDNPEIRIFPNPAINSGISISIPDTDGEPVSITVMDASGKIHYSNSYASSGYNEIPEIRELKAGMYYVHVNLRNLVHTSPLMVY